MTSTRLFEIAICMIATGLLVLPGNSLRADEAAANDPATANPESAQVDADDRSLEEIQRTISARYQRFSKTLTQLHGYMKQTDPARAELLMRVIGKSNEARVDAQLQVILELLGQENPQFGGIVERQEDLIGSLMTLLDTLQSEDELKRLGDEIARLEELIGDLNKLVVSQKGVRAGTERGQPTEGLQQSQQDVTDDTTELAEKIEQQDRERKKAAQEDGAGSESESGEAEPGDADSEEMPNSKSGDSESKPNESEESETGDPSAKPSESGKPAESKPGEGKPSESQDGKPQDGKPQDGKPQEGKPQDGQPQEGQPQSGESGEQQEQSSENTPEDTPGREQVESAIEKMQKAIEELKDKNRQQASREQDQAIAELEKAKAALEEILRQLREEEQMIMLAALEARFRKMLQMQVAVRKSTGQIEEIPANERLPRHRARSTQLARDEREIVLEADKAMILLREEGTSVAFPEAVMQLRDDMQTVSERLNGFVVDELTVAIEDDIIEALDEMVEALRKEMEKLDEKKQQQQQQQQQQPGDPGLVDLIAELKLLRSLQYRVNRRTQQLGRNVNGEQASDSELLRLLNQLAERQARIQRAAYDLSTGRNQ